MPVLLLREVSTTSLSTLVEKAQRKSPPLLEYDLQLNNCHLNLILLSKPDRKINSTSPDEGFESDIDSLSIVSSDNDSFTTEKLTEGESKPNTETDSANGSSSSDSDIETPDAKVFEPQAKKQELLEKESFNLVDCICYTDVKCTNILIFVIKNEALVFAFDNVGHLKNFYTNFTTLKAVANQKAYGTNLNTRFNLLQRTDQNGVTHIEITREAENRTLKQEVHTGIDDVTTPVNIIENVSKNKFKDVNSRQRVESQLINDIKYNTINSKLGPKAKIETKSNSIENILHLDNSKSNLVKDETKLKKVWNSAEDLLEPPKRPQRRRKGRAPQPPIIQEKQDIYSGQFVRVSVSFDPVKNLDKNRLIIKSSLNEPHPKKLQNFNILGKPSITSILRPKEKEILKYESKKLDSTSNRGKVFDGWTNSMPRLLKKPRSRSETRNFIPMAYRYIDTTQDYPPSYTTNLIERGDAHFSAHSPNLSLSNYLRGEKYAQNINNRLFGLSPKLREFADEGTDKVDGKWSISDRNIIVNKDNNLKSVIKVNKDENNKKKNDKKVTFSAYTTVQVV
ncbi:uncharacterized protein LOC130891504 [Diorhabda carinulata]|uniref:uncharacterized protein LOC130891504 n=1 Tax=Diorhabda carinulata TaxID=1163345 RepID=UPI0025A1275B|nr:uncharacterized protein LOC130891504 [Diorhabda carinulata]XP_057652284.1 uncharacterized protein LOC130891504 [Diorhabda carinulata]